MAERCLTIIAEKLRARGERDIRYHEKEAARQQAYVALGRLYLDIAMRVRDGDLTPEQCEVALDLAMPGPTLIFGADKRETEEEKHARLAKLFGIGE